MEVKIGKFTLESLTTGMYSDSKIIYREYVQNSVDSIENAITKRILSEFDARITISINEEEDMIIVEDNGLGINSQEALQILTNIGDSNKRYESNRGFRGIGRLGGLSYCDELIFLTSGENENIATEISYDSKKLRKLLIPGHMDHLSLTEVISRCVTSKTYPEDMGAHYFKVIMKGIDKSTDLFDIESVTLYMKETFPLPYNKKFIWKEKIEQFIDQKDIQSFNIFLSDNLIQTQLYKPFKDKFISNSKSKLHDEIIDIQEICIDYDGKNIAKGWYAITNFFGGICNESTAGIRMRKGNILVGDGRTLSSIFRQDRFSIWVMGEIHMLDNAFIPNARRDNFEQNEIYTYFLNDLKENVGEDISKMIILASRERNNPISKEIRLANVIKDKLIGKIESGFNSDVEKSKLIAEARKSIEKLTEPSGKNSKVIDVLNELTESAIISKNYKLNVSYVGKKEKKILKIVSDVLTEYLEESVVTILIDEIKNRLK